MTRIRRIDLVSDHSPPDQCTVLACKALSNSRHSNPFYSFCDGDTNTGGCTVTDPLFERALKASAAAPRAHVLIQLDLKVLAKRGFEKVGCK